MAFKRSVGVVLFPNFELLDVFGPLEMYGIAKEHFEICMISENAKIVPSAQGVKVVVDFTFSDEKKYDILLVPGGQGTRVEVENKKLLLWLKSRASEAEYVASVCTGSALLAKCGVLEGYSATTNKKAFEWVASQSQAVEWVKQARWVEDGKFFTSSGVSAGIDMTLALIKKLYGEEYAQSIANHAEYEWHKDASWDPYARLYGLS